MRFMSQQSHQAKESRSTLGSVTEHAAENPRFVSPLLFRRTLRRKIVYTNNAQNFRTKRFQRNPHNAPVKTPQGTLL